MKQLELGIERQKELDRNYHLGGRSFYFFDFDDNVAFLGTPLILFHCSTGKELNISSGDFALSHGDIGVRGDLREYEIRWDDQTGTFRNFRDHNNDELARLGLQRQIFVEDLALALGLSDFHWKGPSWNCFYHATFNQRPTSLITARGHDPKTILQGVDELVKTGHLPSQPNFLSIFPVSHKPTRVALGDSELELSTSQLKRLAISQSVEIALGKYGYSPHHRFGMSDDDPKNIQMITEEMHQLKRRYPEMSFFVIETQNGGFLKHEIHLQSESTERMALLQEQMPLF
jgi:hypothetical protein